MMKRDIVNYENRDLRAVSGKLRGDHEEDRMATVKDIKKSYCDDVYSELSEMKSRILAMQDNLKSTYGQQRDIVETFGRHLCELADQIDWKLQILSHACPFDWEGSKDYEENTVSVGSSPGIDFSGGYLGG
jgi:hypothetical protein